MDIAKEKVRDLDELNVSLRDRDHRSRELGVSKYIKGLIVPRRFTTKDVDPFSLVEYDHRTSIIRNQDGSTAHEIKDVEVPKFWSQVATDILAQKYFRKAGVPQLDKQGNPIFDVNGNPILGSEKTARQVISRMVKCWRYWGEKYGYFASEDDAQAFEDELKYMLITQMAAPNSPQWFNTGLALNYGITGTPQGHWYVDPETGQLTPSSDAYTHAQCHACFIQAVSDDLVNEGGIFDLVTREARVFKYGSGTGSNFSSLRGKGERLSGGGSSSGIMSFLKIFDRAAGAIKSGGTTRRAAKMVILDADHPEIEDFVTWKATEEQKVADLYTGSRINSNYLNKIMVVANEQKTVNWKENKELRKVIAEAVSRNVPFTYINRVLNLVEQGKTSIDFPVYDTHYEGEAYITVSGQNSNNTVRIPNMLMNAVRNGGNWELKNRTNGAVAKTLFARELWDKICNAAWSSADPGLQFDDHINEWHTCPTDGKIYATNPCSEYIFLNDTACNLASINLLKFLDEATGTFDVEGFKHATRLWTVVLEISVLMAQFPSKEIAQRSYEYRTLGLGYANLGTSLMVLGIPYDTDQARAISGALTSILCGESYATSAEMAGLFGPFPGYNRNAEHMLKVIRNHKRAAYNSSTQEYEGLTVKPVAINPVHCPSYLLNNARECWDRALAEGEKYGYRNAQVTVIAPTGTIGLVMDCDTTGIEPDFAIVKFKKLAGGGYFKIVNQSVKKALKKLGYNDFQINEIDAYCKGHGTLVGCPNINSETLKAKGFTEDKIKSVDAQLLNAFDLKFVFNKFTLGEDFCTKILGFSKEVLDDPKFDMLAALGFTTDQVQKANDYVCGTMTIEGAPHLKEHHYPVFDCANKCGKYGKRYIPYMAHVKMMGVVQPFISGGISKTINMPNEATIDDVKEVYEQSYNMMVKCIALYRDGSKLSQPLNSQSEDVNELLSLVGQNDEIDETIGPKEVHDILVRGMRKKLPPKRSGFVQEARIGGQKLFVRTGEYPDGELGEVFIDSYKEGAGYRSLLNCFAIAVSKGLQYGVPLEEFVDTFTFTRFEPSGVVSGHPNVKQATSLVDFVFRVLGYEYLGRSDLVHIPDDNGSDGNAKADSPTIKSLPPANKPAITPVISVKPPPTMAAADGDSDADKRSDAKLQGFTGEQCGNCGGMRVKNNGSCTVCVDCGQTTGCS